MRGQSFRVDHGFSYLLCPRCSVTLKMQFSDSHLMLHAAVFLKLIDENGPNILRIHESSIQVSLKRLHPTGCL